MKRIKKVLSIALVYTLGIGVICLFVARAEQINNTQKKLSSTEIQKLTR